MHSKQARWKRAASLGAVFIAVLLAPLTFATAAFADGPTAGEILKHGSNSTCSTSGTSSGVTYQDGSCLTFQGYLASKDSRYNNPNQWAAFDLSGPALPDNANIMMCYLGGSPNYDIYCTLIQLLTSSQADGLGYGPLGASGHPYWANWAHFPTSTSGGTICMSINNPHLCGFDQAQGNGKGDPNSKEIGYAASNGTYKPGLPGQQEDGSIDPIACITQSLAAATGASGGAFDPIGYIFTPVKCAFLWATTMPTDTVKNLVNGQTARWSATQPGKIVNSLDFFDAFSADNTCSGISISLSGLKVPGGPAPKDLRLLNACDGEQLADIAGITKVALTLGVIVAGALKIGRMISQFIKGPQLSEPEQSAAVF